MYTLTINFQTQQELQDFVAKMPGAATVKPPKEKASEVKGKVEEKGPEVKTVTTTASSKEKTEDEWRTEMRAVLKESNGKGEKYTAKNRELLQSVNAQNITTVKPEDFEKVLKGLKEINALSL